MTNFKEISKVNVLYYVCTYKIIDLVTLPELTSHWEDYLQYVLQTVKQSKPHPGRITPLVIRNSNR